MRKFCRCKDAKDVVEPCSRSNNDINPKQSTLSRLTPPDCSVRDMLHEVYI